MKKIFFSLFVIILFIFNLLAQKITTNPIISRGRPVFTSRGAANYLVDNKFKSGTWYVTDSCWIAIPIDKGPNKVFVSWNNPEYPWSNELSPAKCPNNVSFPVEYNILTSPNSSNGIDGDWSVACSVQGNIVTARGHLIDFAGSKWVKISVIKGGGSLDEIEIFDASSGINDSWFFVGTSISAHTYKGFPPAMNFADLINSQNHVYNPIMVRGGIGCISSNDFVRNLSKYLKMAGNVHYWAIEMGTNDAWGGGPENVAVFKQNLQTVIDSCKALGIEPIIARVIATNPYIIKWQVNPGYLKAVDDLTKENNLIAGPDLYTWFLAHPEEINGGTDGVHPNIFGTTSIQRLWAEKMAPLYGLCHYTEITPYIGINQDTMKITAAANLAQNDLLILSPQSDEPGKWSWTGPNCFKSKSREVKIQKITSKNAGTYLVNFTNNDKCVSSYKFEIKVDK
jgi:lysophospholipase L1-like esterase